MLVRSSVSAQSRLNSYLRRATWGLPKSRRQEVWDELEEHLLTRSAHLGALGLGPAAALERALSELGPPARIGVGMAGLYLRPRALLGAVLLILMLVLGIGSGIPKPLTLEVLTQGPLTPSCARGFVPDVSLLRRVSEQDGVTCYTFTDLRVYQGAYLNLNDLERAVQAQGGEARFLDPKRLSLSVEGKRTVLSGTFTRHGQVYAHPALLLAALDRGGNTVLEGYQTPVLQVGSLRVRIGDGMDARVGQNFYQSLLPFLVAHLALPEPLLSLDYGRPDAPADVAWHTLQTPLQEGEVVLLLTRQGRGSYSADVAPVQAGGQLRVFNCERELHFVKDPSQLTNRLPGGSSPALLVRLSGLPLSNLMQGVFLPARANSTAQL